MWQSYESRLGHPADFRVRYRFFTLEEGGRKRLPVQGYRCDFALEQDFAQPTVALRVIHPEFEDASGRLMKDDSAPVLASGTARMWILMPEARGQRHIHDLKLGLKGYFMEGPRRVAEVEIVEIIGLYSNPCTE